MVTWQTPNLSVEGSSPSPCAKIACVAQLVEHFICNETVAGSMPVIGSILKYSITVLHLFLAQVIQVRFLVFQQSKQICLQYGV